MITLEMATAVFRKSSRVSPFLLQRWSSAAAVPLTESLPHIEAEPKPSSRALPEDAKISKLGNGVTVVSMENHSYASNVSVFVRAGSRYESYSQHGLTHLLRHCSFLAAGKRTAFAIARELDQNGSSANATTTREHLIYSAHFLRGNLGHVVGVLGEVVSSPQFQEWEVSDRRHHLELDNATAQTQPSTVVFEALHSAAFRSALSNPLYCPPHNSSAFTHTDLREYVGEMVTGKRTTIAGVGVNHDELVQCAESAFSSVPDGMATTDQPADYVGGGEVRLPSGSPLTHAAIVCKGVSLGASQKELLAAGVLQHVLGAAPTGYVKWGSNAASARLGKAGAAAINAPFAASALNVSYSDNGLFGMYTVSDGTITGKLLRAVMKEFTEVTKGNVSSEDLSRAKSQLKASYLMALESQECAVEELAGQAARRGSVTALEDTLREVDAISKDDVVKFAKAVFSTRATLVAHGNLSQTPRLDQLLSEVSLK